MMSKSFDAKLLHAYLESDYVHSSTGKQLNIGRLHTEVDAFYSEKNVNTYAWITAWNPYSRVLTPSENELRNTRLTSRLHAYNYSEGFSQDKLGDWKEYGFWVENAIPAEMMQICVNFDQNAFVFARRGQVLQLILV